MTEQTYTFKQWEMILRRIKCIDAGGHKLRPVVPIASAEWGSVLEGQVMGGIELQCVCCDALASLAYPPLEPPAS